MDSQGFVSLEFIAGFNRIKNLSTDLELIKLVCQQSAVIEYRTSEIGQDRLRRREGWAQWVLNLTERDESARHDGPKELHLPPAPHPTGFEEPNTTQWPVSATAAPFVAEGTYVQPNGHQVASQDELSSSAQNLADTAAAIETNGDTYTNGASIDASIPAVSVSGIFLLYHQTVR